MYSPLNKFLIITVLLSAPLLHCQDIQIEWGKIPVEDLKMSYCPSDSSASAYILSDIGTSEVNISWKLSLKFSRHIRVKIFDERGYNQTLGSFILNNELEEVGDIAGFTYWLNEDGILEKTGLEKKNIIKEEISDDYTRYSFALPSVKPGCIIDIRYNIKTSSIGLVKGWVFQHSVPVRWSEYKVIYPKVLSYSSILRGYIPFDIREVSDEDPLHYDGH
jgi:hypothetical protein